jgi:porphobilinogen deaminase
VNGGILEIEAMVADREGSKIIRATFQGEAGSPQEAGENLARSMLKAGAAGLIKDMRCR